MSKRDAIERELQRCMAELRTMKVVDPEIARLEAELFGGNRLGALADGVGKRVGTQGYYVDRDGDIPVDELSSVMSCLQKNFHVETHTKTLSGKEYKLVVHSTENKGGHRKICSISVFKGGEFLGYLFTTNDPLNFDNFNRFRGNKTMSEEPTQKCVEQLVFCENKAQVAQKLLGQLDANRLHTLACKNISRIPKLYEALYKEPLVEDVFRGFDEDAKRLFYERYSEYLAAKQVQSSQLDPGDHYKAVGSNVLLSPEYLAMWDEIALVCVISARMKSLESSQHERRLVAALMPKCIIECSQYDDKWAFQIPKTDKKVDAMRWLVDSNEGFAAMITTVNQQIKYQDSFVYLLNSYMNRGKYDAAVDLLCMPKNLMLLGLSERIIQSVWRGELVIDNTLKRLIDEKMSRAGIKNKFELYNPTLHQSAQNAWDVLTNLGQTDQPMDEAGSLHKRPREQET